MYFQIAKDKLKYSLPETLRKAGYFNLRDKKTGQSSYVKRLSKNQFYPRFHLYVTEQAKGYKFKLHLDQKRPSYIGQKAHSGEADSSIVQEEAQRLESTII